eukprot:SAG22_NODE_10537_length_529_cov_0.725581_1_plen_144_part_10
MLLTDSKSALPKLVRWVAGDGSDSVADGVLALHQLVEAGNLTDLKAFVATKVQPAGGPAAPAPGGSKGKALRAAAAAPPKKKMLNWALDSKESSALILAARQFRAPVAEFLCSAGGDPDQADLDGWTALHWACSVRDPQTVQVL